METEAGLVFGIDQGSLFKPFLGHILEGPLPNPVAFLGDEERSPRLHGFPFGPLKGNNSGDVIVVTEEIINI